MAMPVCFRTGKKSYPDHLEAEMARLQMVKENEIRHPHRTDREIPTSSHQCIHCLQWHHRSGTNQVESRD